MKKFLTILITTLCLIFLILHIGYCAMVLIDINGFEENSGHIIEWMYENVFNNLKTVLGRIYLILSLIIPIIAVIWIVKYIFLLPYAIFRGIKNGINFIKEGL